MGSPPLIGDYLMETNSWRQEVEWSLPGLRQGHDCSCSCRVSVLQVEKVLDSYCTKYAYL